MTHRDHRNACELVDQVDVASIDAFQDLLELLAEQGFEGMSRAMQILLNEAMKLQPSHALGAQSQGPRENRAWRTRSSTSLSWSTRRCGKEGVS